MVADHEIDTNAKQALRNTVVRDLSLCPSFFAAAGFKNARLRFAGIVLAMRAGSASQRPVQSCLRIFLQIIFAKVECFVLFLLSYV